MKKSLGGCLYSPYYIREYSCGSKEPPFPRFPSKKGENTRPFSEKRSSGKSLGHKAESEVAPLRSRPPQGGRIPDKTERRTFQGGECRFVFSLAKRVPNLYLIEKYSYSIR